LPALGAGQGVAAVDVHRARAADALAARAPERQGGVDLVLDVDQGVQKHRPVVVGRDLVDVPARVGVDLGVVAIDLVGLDVLRARRGLVNLAGRGLGAFGEGELNHQALSRVSLPARPYQSTLRVKYMTAARAAKAEKAPTSMA